jgi:6-phosphogluconolactonase
MKIFCSGLDMPARSGSVPPEGIFRCRVRVAASRRRVRSAVGAGAVGLLALALAGCGGGGGGGGGGSSPPPPPTTYSIGGTVSGLTGTGLVLQDNGGDNLSVTANGSFTFTTKINAGGTYSVAVLTQPSGQTCTVTNASGTANANVTNVAVSCAASSPPPPSVGKFAYTASYSDGTIYAFTINSSTGALTQVGTPVPDGTNPAAVSLAPNGKFAFSASNNGTEVHAFTINQTTGALTEVSGSPYSTGFTIGAPYPDIAVNPQSTYLYLASSGDAEVAGFLINQTTGALTATPNSPYTAAAGAGGIPAFSPNGNFVYVVNQTANTVSGYAISSSTGALTAIAGSPFPSGTNPTWISFTPNGNFAYVSDTGANAISAYSVNATTGALTALSPATVGTDESPADLTINSSGTYLYVPQGTGTSPGGVQVYSIGATGALTAAGILNQVGIGPRYVDIDPTGAFAYVSSSGTGGTGVYGFTISTTTGELTPITGSPFATGSQPDFITIDPSGKFGYTANQVSGTISGFAVNSTTGGLTATPNSPYTVGANPLFVSISPEAPGIRD